MNTPNGFSKHLLLRYVHNLFVIHFEVGPHVASVMSDAMRSRVMHKDIDLFNYCVMRASTCTPHYHPYIYSTRLFFRSEKEFLRYGNDFLNTQCNYVHSKDVRLEIFLRREKFGIYLLGSKGFEIGIAAQFYTDSVHYSLSTPEYGIFITERQFHQEIDNIFMKFTSIPITYVK